MPLFPVSTSQMCCGPKRSNKHNFDRKQRRQGCLKKSKVISAAELSIFPPFLSHESSHHPSELSGDPDTKGTWHQYGESKYLILCRALAFWLLFVKECFNIGNAGVFFFTPEFLFHHYDEPAHSASWLHELLSELLSLKGRCGSVLGSNRRKLETEGRINENIPCASHITEAQCVITCGPLLHTARV